VGRLAVLAPRILLLAPPQFVFAKVLYKKVRTLRRVSSDALHYTINERARMLVMHVAVALCHANVFVAE
jgi:hypothetical protein